MNQTGSKPLELLTTAGCHLCEEAEAVIARVSPTALASLRRVDIAEDDALIDAYGTRIPVLRCGDRELAWPFSLLDVRGFLEQNVQS